MRLSFRVLVFVALSIRCLDAELQTTICECKLYPCGRHLLECIPLHFGIVFKLYNEL